MTNAVVLAQAGSNNVTMRNKIINGGMVIDQRNAGASVTPATGSQTFSVDRFCLVPSQGSKLSIQQNAGSVTPPVGFSNYLGITSLSAYSILSGDYFTLQQAVEGFNISDLAWGTANAKTVTLSFWVYSSLTGTFGGAVYNSAADRSYPFTYTISNANTWEQKSVTIAGDTTGTWLTTNGAGMRVNWGLGVGSTISGTAGSWAGTLYRSATGATSVVGTNGATFYITGVQLEKGTTATPFEQRLYGTELQLCQRYLPAVNSDSTASTIMTGQPASTTNFYGYFQLNVTPRVPPTGLTVSAASHFTCNPFTGNSASATAVAFSSSSYKLARISFTTNTMTGTTVGAAGDVYFNNASGQLLFTGCEL